jgi:hypothetical protein
VRSLSAWRLLDDALEWDDHRVGLSAGLRTDGVRVTYRASDGTVVETTLDRLRAEEVFAGLPVREFRWYKGRRHYSGWYWSSTMGGLVVYESRLELARIMLADFDPAVTAIAAQPFRLAGQDGSRVRRHVPDVLLASADGGVTVVDVKASGRRADPEVQAVMAWTKRVAALRGWAFEEWYGSPPGLVENVSFLAGYRRRGLIDEKLIPAVLEAAGEPSPVTEVERRVGNAHPALVRPVVMHLLWCGSLVTDMSRPLSGSSLIRLRGTAA